MVKKKWTFGENQDYSIGNEKQSDVKLQRRDGRAMELKKKPPKTEQKYIPTVLHSGSI